ncbi:MAG: S-layer homology domain-containing protein [Syntrophomonadaceae bacterium]
MHSRSCDPESPIRRSLRLVPLFVLLPSAAFAISMHWKATPADANWSNGANWAEGHPPNPGDDLTFPATSTILSTNNDLAAGLNITGISFNGPGYTLAGNGITSGEILCTSGVAGKNTITLPMTINTTIVVGTQSACTIDLEGDIDGPGGILSTGGGPVILGGTDSYSGATAAGGTGGVLYVNGTLSGTSGVTVNESSGTPLLRGHGSFSAPLNVNNSFPTEYAVVAPGTPSATGILSTGNASFGASGTRTALVIRINGTTAGTDYDQLDVGGTVALTHVALDVKMDPNFLPIDGTPFTILKNDGGGAVSGQFAGLAEGALFLVNETTFQISYVGGAGHDVVLTAHISPAFPPSIAVDAAGNGVLEVGETAALQPTWTNATDTSQHLTGATANFFGIGVATTVFGNPDASGDYGTIASGASAQCVDCYTVQLTSPTRPQQHWDTRIEETIAPFSVIKRWTLHVGESFPDVPTSHQFYKFVENLFHNGVTGGCAGGNYCPSNPVTRAQMAVFLLKGEHGSTYLPPACAATMFTDVPCPTGGFVDWINQLATEGITGGCGGGNYCPGNSVTRGQMAVFLLKGEHGGAYVPPACSATVFTDVPCPSAQFVNFINELNAEGITGGCGGGNYCPANPVNRGQMAVFLVKTFGLLLYGP